MERTLDEYLVFCKMLAAIFRESPPFPSRHVHCSWSNCLKILFSTSKPKFEVNECHAATYVLAAGSTGVRKTQHLRNLNYSKNIVMVHTWTVSATSLPSHLGFVICQNVWSPPTAGRRKRIDALQPRWTCCRILSSTLPCLAWYIYCMAIKASSSIVSCSCPHIVLPLTAISRSGLIGFFSASSITAHTRPLSGRPGSSIPWSVHPTFSKLDRHTLKPSVRLHGYTTTWTLSLGLDGVKSGWGASADLPFGQMVFCHLVKSSYFATHRKTRQKL